MSELVARTGRQMQRYENGYRLIAGCIPFKYSNVEENGGDSSKKFVEVLMINSNSGPGLLFPKGGWENDETAEQAALREAMEEAGVCGDLVHFLGYYPFKSKTLLDEFSPEGWCKAAMYALIVKEELESWPEMSHRQRSWLTIPEAIDRCRHAWMREALEEGFQNWYAQVLFNPGDAAGRSFAGFRRPLQVNLSFRISPRENRPSPTELLRQLACFSRRRPVGSRCLSHLAVPARSAKGFYSFTLSLKIEFLQFSLRIFLLVRWWRRGHGSVVAAWCCDGCLVGKKKEENEQQQQQQWKQSVSRKNERIFQYFS